MDLELTDKVAVVTGASKGSAEDHLTHPDPEDVNP
jgi:hypothetical protein